MSAVSSANDDDRLGVVHAAALQPKRVIGVGEPPAHFGRIVRGQHMRARGLELLRRDACGLRRRIERPAEMLARMAHADARAVMDQHFLVERADQIELLGERGRRALLAGREIMREIAGKPRPPVRAAPDHHGIRAGLRQRRDRALEIRHVAVDDDRNGHRLLHGAHRGPVGRALVELAARAAMHRDEADAGRFGAARKLGRIARIVVPAEPHLQRDRHADRADGRVDQGQRMIEIAHQRRAGLLAGHVLGRAAHVDVDDVGAGAFRDARALRHPVRLAAGELHDVEPQPLAVEPALLRRAALRPAPRSRSFRRSRRPRPVLRQAGGRVRR